jgi:putative membrane protein
MGRLAQKNGGSDGVRSFGQMLVQDHSAANEKATSLAQTQGVTPPTAPKPEASRLSKLNGEAFDMKFAKHMVADHKKDIKEFEEQAKESDDVASFAKDTLPTLKKHLQTAQSWRAANRLRNSRWLAGSREKLRQARFQFCGKRVQRVIAQRFDFRQRLCEGRGREFGDRQDSAPAVGDHEVAIVLLLIGEAVSCRRRADHREPGGDRL